MELDLKLKFTLRWYRLIEDDLLVKVFRPGYCAVQAYPWSSPVVWWESSSKRRKRTVGSEEDQAYVGPVDDEAEFEKSEDEDGGGDGVAAGTTGSVDAAVHPFGDS